MSALKSSWEKKSKINSRANDKVVDSLDIHNKMQKHKAEYSMQSKELITEYANKNAMTSKAEFNN